jgi:ABC-type oligopeptide transport system ATPase subunit
MKTNTPHHVLQSQQANERLNLPELHPLHTSSVMIQITNDVITMLKGTVTWEDKVRSYIYNQQRIYTASAVRELEEVVVSDNAFQQFGTHLIHTQRISSFRGVYKEEMLRAGIVADRRILALKT